jgi:hypothetical protein
MRQILPQKKDINFQLCYLVTLVFLGMLDTEEKKPVFIRQ